ncbi:MAG: adenosine deaminase [Spirochaetes bacterium GWD1_61_31]|nr:MAG: adenosine deaminase [Spirochaetes bacterium GWB1_60_80]OHD35026.1 MAG: adenosine deaminase [Spirochaetes bacterium GWC1_61_12]OHD36572.1 MAG: adenosine deaminase [Spirochaetes bacterium GWD1_61_31]OHD41737.1 MAG: adenosine deaminase [Spirochaetes bacterium GWE1_60_18]OHD61596.1 MAG: adenosine deaminase [Spirochaetes bacterium GWF1_60_12]HAP44043.1 adenosine deaminase family protein [Spirochaetaceae bacterium]
MTEYSLEFLRRLPKTDLHLHLDGSMRLGTLVELARDAKVELPSYTEDGLRATVFKDRYANLNEYLKGFAYTCAVMQNAEAIERISYELAMDNFAEGVRYIEPRFAPQLMMNDRMSLSDVLGAADRGLKRAKQELAALVVAGEPEFEYGLIACAMRFCNEKFSPFYRQFFGLHQYSSSREVIRDVSLELAKGAIAIARGSDIQLVGFDLAGAEYGYPADNHRESYDYVHKRFLMKTVHAGEAYGPESIFQAITKLHADRIGHGLFLFDESKVLSPDIADPARYVNDLVNYIAGKRITLEVCLTSNLQTVPEMKDLASHPLGRMLDNHISVTLCTDNRLVSNTTVTTEYCLATRHFDMPAPRLKELVVNGFKRAFFPGSYAEKRTYVRQAITYYERVAAEFGVV